MDSHLDSADELPIVASPSDDIVSAAAQSLLLAGLTVSVAESCTGGLLGAALSDVSGSSAYFMGGVLAYDNAVKIKLLGVSETLIEQHGAVGPQVAAAMATGVVRLLGTNLGIAVTGIAGPTGGTPEKPVGTTCIALFAPDAQITRVFLFQGDRSSNRAESVREALILLTDYLEDTMRLKTATAD